MKILVDSCIRGLDRTPGEQKRKVEFGEAAGGGKACSQQFSKSSEHENSGKK